MTYRRLTRESLGRTLTRISIAPPEGVLMFKVLAARRLLLLSLVGILVAALGGLVTSTATAASPAPTRLWSTACPRPSQRPMAPRRRSPTVLVAAGQNFFVDVSFQDATGAPAAFNSDTTLSITSNQVTLSPSTTVVPKGVTSWRLTTTATAAANQVSLTVKVASGRSARTVAPGTSSVLFDVMSELRLENSARDVRFQQGIGGQANCTEATRDDPVCGIVILPRGSVSDKVLLSLGACDSAYAGCGSTRGSLVQTLADLTGLYTKTSPATLLMRCDKSLCGSGIDPEQDAVVLAGGQQTTPDGTSVPGQGNGRRRAAACVDYVQSKRDGSGDTYLYLLFTEDARVSFG
jgi:hypothetical protein